MKKQKLRAQSFYSFQQKRIDANLKKAGIIRDKLNRKYDPFKNLDKIQFIQYNKTELQDMKKLFKYNRIANRQVHYEMRFKQKKSTSKLKSKKNSNPRLYRGHLASGKAKIEVKFKQKRGHKNNKMKMNISKKHRVHFNGNHS